MHALTGAVINPGTMKMRLFVPLLMRWRVLSWLILSTRYKTSSTFLPVASRPPLPQGGVRVILSITRFASTLQILILEKLQNFELVNSFWAERNRENSVLDAHSKTLLFWSVTLVNWILCHKTKTVVKLKLVSKRTGGHPEFPMKKAHIRDSFGWSRFGKHQDKAVTTRGAKTIPINYCMYKIAH
jgi:hypothetical protein